MLLKALELKGFKSFPDKTVLILGHGLTAVVGPNGSGKSNISDAIRWVLGEQSTKSLRGAKMEDVIFSGTAQRKGLGFAEVSLVIDNAARRLDFDADEVKVTRRYYRSGESEYLLNNATVRLKDIQLLFMDTGLGRDGYSIIGQGKIGDIVASKSQQRRDIFEEAAGIAKYRYRKNEAERRLTAAEDNLLRLRDILKELEERVGPLKLQAEKAKTYLTLAGEKRELEIGLWLHTIARSKQKLRELSSQLELARNQYDDTAHAMDAIEDEITRQSEEGQRLAAQMDEVRRGAQTLEERAAQADSDAALLRNDIFHNTETMRRYQADIDESQAGGAAFEAERLQREQAVADARAAAAGAEARQLQLAEQLESLSRNTDEMTGQIDALSAQAAALSLQMADWRVKEVTGESSLGEIARRMEQLNREQAAHRTQVEETRAEAAACRADLDDCAQRIEGLQNSLRGYELRWQSRAAKRDTARKEADTKRLDAEEARRRVRLLEDLERNLEGFAGSVKAVVQQAERGRLRGIHGPVSRLVDTAPDTALAIETALGGAAQNIVCDSEGDAKQGIAYLKETKAGRATFLPLSSVKGTVLDEPGLADRAGFVGIASALVTCAPAYEGVVRSLLGRTAVAEDLDAAVAIARAFHYRFRVVTLDGQVVNAGGSMTGGSHVKNAGLLSRRAEIDRLRAKAEELAAAAAQSAESAQAAAQEAAAAEAAVTGARGELATAQEDRIRLEGECRRLADLADAAVQAVQAADAELAALTERSAACRADAAAAREETQRLSAQVADLETRMGALTGGRQELTRQREALSEQVAQCKLERVACDKEREAQTAALEALAQRRADAAGKEEQLRAQMDAIAADNTALEQRIAALGEQAAALRAQAAGTEETVQALRRRREEAEQQQTALRRRSREQAEQREQLGREVTRLEEKAAGVQQEADDIERRLFEEYELTRLEAEATAKPVEDPAAAGRRLGELKSRIRALGSVNVDAIEEYKEVSERFDFLSAQVHDVEVSRDELRKLIHDLTGHMRDLFLDRFRQINYQFGLVFRDLFGGGKAELRLSEPDDILESGIDMYVQPPGKVILNLDALSGGEKALVAIAVLFAILKVSPSPFCILDEIEAALDDVNVDRYAAYLRRLSDQTQFIVITHRRGTMEEADVLYGVTMQEQGVSKLLELRASEVEARLGLKTTGPT